MCGPSPTLALAEELGHDIICSRQELSRKTFVAGAGGAIGLERARRPQGRGREVPDAEFASLALQWAGSV